MIRRMGTLAVMLVAFLGAGMAVSLAQTGDVTCFTPSQVGSCTERVLPHAEFKTVVTEFVDPQNTGVGYSLSWVVWREILESISNLAGARVVLAQDEKNLIAGELAGRDYVDYLHTDYHQAAVKIAEFLDAHMSVWGVVLEDESTIYFEPFITLLPVEEDPWTALRLINPEMPDIELSAAIPHRRLSFAPTVTTRDALFGGHYVTRCTLLAGCPDGVLLRAEPFDEAPIVATYPVGAEFHTVDMLEDWFAVERSQGGLAFINIKNVEITPRVVTFPKLTTGVNVRVAPDIEAESRGKEWFDGDYQVLAVRRHANGEFWYQLKGQHLDGWIAGRLVQSNWHFPIVHFIAGLYRYGLGDYKRATQEFERFIDRSDNENNVTLAAAYQFLAASRIAYRGPFDKAAKKAREDLAKAIELTPFDPAAYTLHAVLQIGGGADLLPAFTDLERALALDPRDSTALAILADLNLAAEQGRLDKLAIGAPVNRDIFYELTRLNTLYRPMVQLVVEGASPPSEFEIPSNRLASQILPAQLIAGPYHRVRETVVSYGYMHHYTVDSQFGVFDATGDGALRKLVNEIYAIASLKEFKTTDAFLTSVGTAAKAPFSFARNLITHPIDTVSGVPQGVFQIFGNAAEAVTMEHDPAEDSRVKQLLFVSSWKRDFAAERGVDVYSSNKVLQEELNSVGWAAAIGGLTVSAVSTGASAAAVTIASKARLADEIGNALKEEPPSRLHIINMEKLQAMGVPEALANRFLEHPHFTPRHDTAITANLARLTNARGRDKFLETVLAATDEVGANFYMNMAQTLSGYNDTVARIEDISIVAGLTMARAQNGRVLIPFPLDHGIWSKRGSEIVNHLVTTYRAQTGFTGGFDFWVTGTLSPLAHQGMASNGIAVTEHVDALLRMIDSKATSPWP